MTSKLIPASLFNATPHASHVRRYCAPLLASSSLHLVHPVLLSPPPPRSCFPLLPLHSLPSPPPPSRLFTTTTAPSHLSTPFTPQQSASTIHAIPPQALFDFPTPVSPSASNPSSIFDFFDKAFPTPRRSYVFSHAATGFPKVGGKKVASPALSPEEDAKYYSVQVGEDSYFRRYDALGVADGVGGWSGTTGANPALYSRKLMHYAYLELERYDNIEDEHFYDYYNVSPVEVLQQSYDHCQIDAKREGILGSTTACLAVLRDDELRIANLGDCGLTIIRHNHFIFRTEEQQHSFNFPYQLGTGQSDRQFDQPSDAWSFTVKVQRGDIVVLGTDGVFDNLFDEEILEEVVRHVASRTGVSIGGQRPRNTRIEPQAIADALARRARSVSEDSRNANSPFQSRAVQEGLYYQGGKRDDISVLVAVINDSEDTPDRRLS